METKTIRHWHGEVVPPEDWGKDHLSTFMYVETRVVDQGGKLNPQHMRSDGKEYPSYCKNFHLKGHNDYHCVEDLEDAGYLVNKGTGTNPLIALTDKGWELASKLRRARAEGASLKDIQL